uniref:RNA helicase n=1 Tax=Kalanchoe fedtschenkoi TaxID=63787 RepID=A0A7N0SWU3_KALFE
MATEEALTDSTASNNPEAEGSCNLEDSSVAMVDSVDDTQYSENCGSDKLLKMPLSQHVSTEEQKPPEDEDVELGNFFSDEATSEIALPSEKTRKLNSTHNIDQIDGIWKRVYLAIGDPPRIPKAVLQQLCQRSEWDAPKFNKVRGKGSIYFYTVSILKKASGRGKSRKAGGLITLQLPDQDTAFESAEDAQNRVAAFALHQLFPDLPVHLLIAEPYASLVIKWIEGESSTKLEEAIEDRRAEFVDQLLKEKDDISTNTIDQMDSLREESQQKPLVEEKQNFPDVYAIKKHESAINNKNAESFYLRKELANKKNQQRYKDMLETRGALPIAEMKNEILQLLKTNNVLVVCGETGSGKTTQVPQFILDDMIEGGCGGECSIICTQPRRIAAISVAERVADERCEPSPGMNGSLVGYQVRLDSARNEKTKLLFCTTGILLRMIAGDNSLNGITHVIVDEVHERSLLGDFLLIILKDIIERQETRGGPKLKVILMSATVDSNLFSRYFNDCPVVFGKGRTHPVTTYYLEDIYDSINYRLDSDSPASIRSNTFTKQNHLVSDHRGKKNLVLSGWGDDSVLSEVSVNPYYDPERYQSFSQQTQHNLKNLNEDVIDYDLLEDLVCYVDETCAEGAILIFLPGVSEIDMLYDKLAASYRFSGLSSDWLLPLHSSVTALDQKKVFLRSPENIRKVIIATNIAETSITIDDVVYVIDCGKHKENRYNPQKKLSSMVEDWISQANARQRRGRAGRVKPGVCYSLYTRVRYERHMRPFQVPEMQRMPLVELCLQIKLVSLGNIRSFLSKALEPPKEEAVTSAIQLLYEVGAFEGDEELTPLGYHLAKLPVDVLIGKMLIYGGIFGCLSPILSIAAFLSYKSPFVYPKDEKHNVERAKLALLAEKLESGTENNDVDGQSDHLIMMVAYKKWEKIMRERGARYAQQFCNSYFLSSSVMYMIRDMRVQFGTLLADIGLINIPKNNLKLGKNKEHMDNWLANLSQPFNMNSHRHSVVKSILCAGLYPNVAATESGLTSTVLSTLKRPTSYGTADRPWWYDGRREVHIHPSSINSGSRTFKHPFVVFLEKVETNKVFLRDTTVVSPYSVLLFGGSINVQHQTGLVTIDGWMKISAAAQTAVLFKQLRLTLHSVLKEMIRHPEKASAADNEVVKSIVHLFLEEDQSSK